MAGFCYKQRAQTATGSTTSSLTRPTFITGVGSRRARTILIDGASNDEGCSVSYTLSKATNTAEPDGNAINPNESIITRLGEEERGPSVVDQRHRADVRSCDVCREPDQVE